MLEYKAYDEDCFRSDLCDRAIPINIRKSKRNCELVLIFSLVVLVVLFYKFFISLHKNNILINISCIFIVACVFFVSVVLRSKTRSMVIRDIILNTSPDVWVQSLSNLDNVNSDLRVVIAMVDDAYSALKLKELIDSKAYFEYVVFRNILIVTYNNTTIKVLLSDVKASNSGNFLLFDGSNVSYVGQVDKKLYQK